MNKELKRLFIILALYSMAGGVLYNFQNLWMQDNNLSIKTIGTVLSICSLLSVSIIFLCSNLIKKNHLKKFTMILLLIKGVTVTCLYLLNGSGLSFLIKFLIMIDYVVDVEIWASIYPMMSLIRQTDKTYAQRDLIYSITYYFGVLLTSFLLGKNLLIVKVDYNFYCLITAIIIFIALFILIKTDINKYCKIKKESKDKDLILSKLVKIIHKDRITCVYLLLLIFGQIAYSSVLAMPILLLTNSLDFLPAAASNLYLCIGIAASVTGFIVLSKLTFKNDYINLSIKYVVRFILFLLAVILNNKIMYLIAFLYPLFISQSYTHITDAPYVNRFKGDYQLAFCNLKEMVKYLGSSIGTFLCGFALNIDIRVNFMFASFFVIFQVVFSFYGLYLRNKEEKHGRKQLG